MQNETVMAGLKRILVVDDEDTIRLVLRKTLERVGYEVLTAENGEKALEILQRQPIDLLLTDIMMPGMNGIQLIAKAKSLNHLICCVAMTAYVNLESARESMKQGAFDYLSKPFDINQVKARILEAYHRQSKFYAETEKRILSKLGSLDPLTETLNPRDFHTALEGELQKPESQPLSLLYLDVAALREINRAYGLEIGDEVLVRVARCLMENFPSPARVCRYADDEFVVMIPKMSKTLLEGQVEPLKTLISKIQFPGQPASGQTILASIFVAGSPEDGQSAHALVNAVQKQMRQKKKEGTA